MSGLNHPLRAKSRPRLVAFAALAVLCTAVPGAAWSQAVQPAPQSMIIQVAPAPMPATAVPATAVPVRPPVVALPAAPAPAPAVVAPEPESSSLINEMSRWFKDSTALLPAMPSFAGWGDGSDRLTRLNKMVKGRVACPVAANGAPDCKVASDRLCQSKGYKDGKSLDTDAAQVCSAKAMIPGRKPEEGDCRTENYVTQALCQ